MSADTTCWGGGEGLDQKAVPCKGQAGGPVSKEIRQERLSQNRRDHIGVKLRGCPGGASYGDLEELRTSTQVLLGPWGWRRLCLRVCGEAEELCSSVAICCKQYLTPIIVLYLSYTVVSSTYINVFTLVQADDEFFIISFHRLGRVSVGFWSSPGTGRMKLVDLLPSCALCPACSKHVVCFVLLFLCPWALVVTLHIRHSCPGVVCAEVNSVVSAL